MKKNIVTIVLALAFASAHAGEWYGGLGIGQNQWDAVENAVQNFAASEQSSCETSGFFVNCMSDSSADNTDIGLGIFAGYRINENVAIEAAYVDLGEYSGQGASSGDWTDGTFWYTASSAADLKAEASAITLSVIGYLPVTSDRKGSIFGKLGIARWDADASAVVASCDGAGTCFAGEGSDSNSGTDPLFGLGYEHRFNNIGVRGMYEIIKDVGDEDDVKRLSLNALWYF